MLLVEVSHMETLFLMMDAYGPELPIRCKLIYFLHHEYLYEQIQSTKKPGIMTNYGYVKQYFSGVYRIDRTGIGYCDKENMYKGYLE